MRSRLQSGWLVLALAAVVAVAQESSPPLTLTLEDAIEQALAHNRDLVRGALDVQRNRLAVEQAREATRNLQVTPLGSAGAGEDREQWRAGVGVSAVGNYGTRVGVAATANQIAVDGAPTRRRAEIQTTIEQPLLRDFGPLVQQEPVVLANEALLAARRVWERDRSALVVQVVELFETLIYLRHQVTCDEEFSERMSGLRQLAAARAEQGKSSRTDVLRMEWQEGEAQLRLETGRAQLAIRFQELANVLGLPLTTSFTLVPPPLLDLTTGETDEALAVALAERPDYAQALQDVETSSRQERLARRRLLPNLRLAATQTTYGEGPEWSDATRLDQEDWFVGLTADMNLNLRGTRLDVARAGVDVAAREHVAEIVRNRLAVEVHAALAEYRRSRAALALAARNRELAADRAELARTLFTAGRAPADMVSDAETDSSSAMLRELAARREAAVAAYRLLHVLGTLVPAPKELLRPTSQGTES
ncbi:MAG TPA: TolC family protein [Kiritimatiellia bacterium]|nr:TolC family protein [Kiritimatiellia bacterium]